MTMVVVADGALHMIENRHELGAFMHAASGWNTSVAEVFVLLIGLEQALGLLMLARGNFVVRAAFLVSYGVWSEALLLGDAAVKALMISLCLSLVVLQRLDHAKRQEDGQKMDDCAATRIQRLVTRLAVKTRAGSVLPLVAGALVLWTVHWSMGAGSATYRAELHAAAACAAALLMFASSDTKCVVLVSGDELERLRVGGRCVSKRL